MARGIDPYAMDNVVDASNHSYSTYYKSGRWKCPHSPTGAHHWICQPHLDLKVHDYDLYICKWCNRGRWYPATIGVAMSGEFKKLLAQGRLDETEMGNKGQSSEGVEAKPEAVKVGATR